MQSKRVLRHLLFWVFFFCISLFNELYFSSSWSSHPDLESFLRAVLAQLLIYSVKITVVYYCIYLLIPRWSARQTSLAQTSLTGSDRSSLKYVAEFIFVLLAGAFCMRLIVQGIIWVYVFPGEERVMTWTSLLGRYFYSLFDLLPITLVAVAIKLVQLRIMALKQETILVQEKITSELLYLKAQTNPHFLFNTLNVIYALSRKQDVNTPKAILQLSSILRYILYEINQKTNPVRDELQLIGDYIALQKLRFQEHVRIEYTTDVQDEKAEISPLLLLPLVENAFKHSNGLDMRIEIDVRVREGVLQFRVSNTLPDPSEADALIKDGIGLSNIKRQLAILYRDYSFSAYKTERDFIVDLRIALSSFAYG